MDEGNWTLPPDPDEEAAKNKKMVIISSILIFAVIGELIYFTMFYEKYPLVDLFIPKPTPNLYPYYVPTRTPTITPVQEFQWKIIELNTVIPGFDNISFSFKLEGYNDKKNSVVYLFDKDELNNMKVTDSSGKTISYKDLEIGQLIKIIRLYDSITKLYKGFDIVIIN